MKRACDVEVRPSKQSIASRYAGRTVVAIGAHPDDLEIGIGGTLAKMKQAGAHVVMCVASIPKDYDVRLAEAKRGAEILGCELKILMSDGPKRLEDVKTCDLVGMLDGLNRYRYRRNPELLAEWELATHVRAAPRRHPADPEAGDSGAGPDRRLDPSLWTSE